jgi:hypothetical protein
VKRSTAQSKTGIFRDYGAVEIPPVFQACWSGMMVFKLKNVAVAHLEFPSKFLHS